VWGEARSHLRAPKQLLRLPKPLLPVALFMRARVPPRARDGERRGVIPEELNRFLRSGPSVFRVGVVDLRALFAHFFLTALKHDQNHLRALVPLFSLSSLRGSSRSLRLPGALSARTAPAQTATCSRWLHCLIARQVEAHATAEAQVGDPEEVVVIFASVVELASGVADPFAPCPFRSRLVAFELDGGPVGAWGAWRP
jgi:hypothetical protein